MLLDQYQQYLTNLSWQYEIETTDHTLVSFSVQHENQQYYCLAQIRESPINQIVFYVQWEDEIEQARRSDLAVFVSGLNFYLAIGAFELEPTSGYLRYRTSIEIGNHPLDDELLNPLTFIALTTASHYQHLIQQVIDATLTPKDALAQAKTLMEYQ